MLRREPKVKDRRRVPVPEGLREALREAWFLINEAKRDSDVRVDYGDAIQVGGLIGGRVGSKKRPFEFTYYADGSRGGKERWRLALSPIEIEDVVDGHQIELSLYCCRTPNCGFKSNDPDALCDCDYVEDGFFGNFEFPKASKILAQLGISGLSETSTREDVVSLLGPPKESGGGEKHPSLGFIWPWIKYFRPECQLRFEFFKSAKIRKVSTLEPDWQPGPQSKK